MIRKKIVQNKTEVALIILLFFMMIPIILACIYAVPSRDDFLNTIGWMEYSKGGHFKYLFASVWYDFRKHQGTYFGSFINAFPAYYVLGYVGLRIWLLFNVLLFFSSLIVFLSSLLEWMGVDANHRLISVEVGTILVLFYALCMHDYCDEVFYWYTGACMYTVPVSFSFLAIICYFKYEINSKKRYLCIGSFFAFLGSGGILAVPAFLCGFLMLTIVYNFLVLRAIKKSAWIGAAAFVGAVLNAFAPGNMNRATDNLDYLATISGLVRRVSWIYSHDIENGSLLLIIIVSGVVGFKFLRSSSFKFSNPCLIVLMCVLGPIIVDIPYMLATSDSLRIDYIGNRYEFIEHLCIGICSIFASMYMAGWIHQKYKFELKKEHVVILLLICCIQIAPLFDAENFIELTPFHMIQHMIINDNDFKKFSLRQEDILKQIEESDEEDVVVYSYRKKGGEWCNLSLIGLTDDENDLWYSVNRYLAKYYGKNTVTLKYLD